MAPPWCSRKVVPKAPNKFVGVVYLRWYGRQPLCPQQRLLRERMCTQGKAAQPHSALLGYRLSMANGSQSTCSGLSHMAGSHMDAASCHDILEAFHMHSSSLASSTTTNSSLAVHDHMSAQHSSANVLLSTTPQIQASQTTPP